MSIFKQNAQNQSPDKRESTVKKPSPFSLIMSNFKQQQKANQANQGGENSATVSSPSPVKKINAFNSAIGNLVKQATDLENMVKILQTTDPDSRTKDEIRVGLFFTLENLRCLLQDAVLPRTPGKS